VQVPAGVLTDSDGRSIYESDRSVFEADGNDEYYLDEGTDDAARAKLQFVTRFCRERDKTLLDVGASFGHFLAVARDHFRVTGIEISRHAVQWSVDHFAVDSRIASLYELPADLPKAFDAITAWDVIEHVEDPRGALAVVRDRLVSGGWLFLSTPDAGSLMARVLGRHWYYQDPIQHIHLFSRANLHRLLREAGFAVVATKYLGRRYRVSYVVNRLRYFAGGGAGTWLLDRLARLPESVRQRHVAIKLWDVMAVAARRLS
jgi:2-polyprenyl-3-methyl-5-hydroxy-6-metoxy-1,4-benzoquinol methylase